MSTATEKLEKLIGQSLFDYQVEAIDFATTFLHDKARICLYYKTGAGKSITALGCIWALGWDEVVVITPPSTFGQWEEWAKPLSIKVTAMSHAKFRQKTTKLDRKVPVIADEFHLFGGHTGQGWKKLDQLSRGLQAPVILASATPNYNDAERVYCIKHILDPHGTKGGFLEFLYRECITKQNPFGMIPEVLGFQSFTDAAGYLAALPNVMYLPDDLVYQIVPVSVVTSPLPTVDKFGYDPYNHRMVASLMEERHLRALRNIVEPNGLVRPRIFNEVMAFVRTSVSPVLIFSNHATIAEALHRQFISADIKLVTGKTSTKEKAEIIRRFNVKQVPVLIGTASLATGTDGMDKVCDNLLIVDDTDDDALRRQLIGRIMPRGATATGGHNKRVYRLEFY